MGRSQRHMIVEQNTTSAGEVHAQGVVADSIVAQVDPSALNVLTTPPEGSQLEIPAGGFVVPEGPSGGPLAGSSMSGAVPDALAPPPDPEPPEPGFKPVLNSINPSSARIGDPDLNMHVNGNYFVDGAVIVFNGGDEATTYKSGGQLSTIIKPSLATTPGSYPVWVRNPDGQRSVAEKTFTFNPEVTPLARTIPSAAYTISRIDPHTEGLAITLASGDVQLDDTVLIEATGNTSVNGTYTVLSVDGPIVVVGSEVDLTNPIEAKGRLTVIDAGS